MGYNKMKTKTIELIIESPLPNDDLLSIFNRGADNLKECGIKVIEINIKNSAHSLVRGLIN